MKEKATVAGWPSTGTVAAVEDGPRFPNRARERREELGFTRDQVAAAAGKRTSTLAGIENGHHRPSASLAVRIADQLDCDPDDLFDRHPCGCGCGELVFGRFASGHNTRTAEHSARLVELYRPKAKARLEELGVPDEKTCKRCGKTFSRFDDEIRRQPLRHWLTREHCSYECAHPRHAPRPCDHCGATITKPRSSQRFCSLAHARRYVWIEATRISDKFLAFAPGSVRQAVKNRARGRSGYHRPRGYTELQRKGVVALRLEENLGYDLLSRRSGLTVKQCRAIVAEAKASGTLP